MKHDTSSVAINFQLALLDHVGLNRSLLNESGVSFISNVERADTGIVVCYQLGEHSIVWGDPALRDVLAPVLSQPVVSPDEFVQWGTELGHEHIGSGVMRVLPGALVRDAASGIESFDAGNPDDERRIREFIATCDEDDVDEADIDVDSLDPVIRCAVDGSSITAFASALPFDLAEAWWDIGVVTHADHRRRGLGAACVAAVIEGIIDAGGLPLYRHDPENLGSAGLATSLGFVPATHLTGLRIEAS